MRRMKQAVHCLTDLTVFLLGRENARWGHNTLRGLLLLAVAYVWPLQRTDLGPRDHALSIIGFLPDSVLFDDRLFVLCKMLFVVFAALWFLDLLVPRSAWIATVSLTLVLSLFMESRRYTLHQYHVLAMLLWVFCLWYQVCAPRASANSVVILPFSPPRMPRWVYALSLYYLCLTYSFSGMTKLLSNGLAWANGTSLQLWTLLWGDVSAYPAQVLLRDRRFAEAAQAATLFFESAAVVVLFFPRWRRVIGAGLLGFHLLGETVFHYRFYPNIFAVAAILLFYPGWSARGLRRARDTAHDSTIGRSSLADESDTPPTCSFAGLTRRDFERPILAVVRSIR